MSQDFNGAQQGNMKPEVQQAITQLGLDYRLMTQFTSFVAVEEMIVTDGGQPRRIDVPVEVPEGVNREASFGANLNARQIQNLPINGRTANFAYLAGGVSSQTATVTVVSESEPLNRSSATDVVTVYKASPPPRYDQNTSAPKPKSKRTSSGGIGSVSGGGGGGGAGGTDYDKAVSPEEIKRREMLSKFHPSVLAVVERLKDVNSKPGADEAKFIHDGKAEIQIWLNDKSDETMAKLKELGFEVVLDPKTAKLVIGRLPIDKLAALADLKSVRYVAPEMRNN